MPLRVWLVIVLLAATSACAAEPRHAPPPSPAAAPAMKPMPPLAVHAGARALGAGEYEVALVATPSVAVDSLVVALVPAAGVTPVGAAQVEIGASSAGRANPATLRVRVDGTGAELIAVAHARVAPGHTARATAAVIVGSPPRAVEPTPPPTILLPSGRRVDEVRP